MLQYQITVLDTGCFKKTKGISTSQYWGKAANVTFSSTVTSQRKHKSPFCILVIITETSITSYLFAFHTECFPICLWLQVCLFFHMQKGSAMRAEPYPLEWPTQNMDIMALQPAHSTLPPAPTAAHHPLCSSDVVVSWAEGLLSLLQQLECPAHQKQHVKNS